MNYFYLKKLMKMNMTNRWAVAHSKKCLMTSTERCVRNKGAIPDFIPWLTILKWLSTGWETYENIWPITITGSIPFSHGDTVGNYDISEFCLFLHCLKSILDSEWVKGSDTWAITASECYRAHTGYHVCF